MHSTPTNEHESTSDRSIGVETPSEQPVTEQPATEEPATEEQVTEQPVRGYTAFQAGNRKEEKKAIAKFVSNEIIREGMSILLDAGSTTYEVGLALFDRPKLSGLTIMTNNMLVFNEFTKRSSDMAGRGNVLALTGGVYNQNHEALFGQAAEQVLRSFYPLITLIGASGFMVKKTSSRQSEYKCAFHHDLVSEVVTKKAIAATPTLHRVILCDYSKIGVWDASCFATIQELAAQTEKCTIVTSIVPDLPDEEKKYFEDQYEKTYDELEKLSIDNVNMIRVDYEGKKEI